MKNAILESPLMESLERQDLNKKYLAYDSGTPQSTVSDHTKGKQPVGVAKALEYSETLQDSRFNSELGNIYLGLVGVMTGDKFQINPLALDILQQKESNERKAKKEKVLEILTLCDEKLSHDDKDYLNDYVFEFLDELLIETTQIVSLLDICETSLMEAVNSRMSYWQEKGYMRKG